jgi:lipoprotein-releasing system permease protein
MRTFEGFIAERYLRTRKKGAFVRIMVRFARWGIAFGVFALVVTQSMTNGFREEIQANLFSATAHFTIFHLTGALPDTEATLAKIRAVPGVAAASPTRMESALLKSTNIDAQGLQVKAIDPASAHSTSSIFDSAAPISIEQLKPGEILIGKELEESVSIHPGDEVTLAFMHLDLGLSGLQPRMMALKVAGTFSSHISEYDRHWAFIHLDDAKRLAGSDQAEFIEVRTKSVDDIERIKTDVLQALNGNNKGPFLASDLRDTNRPLFEALMAEKIIFSTVMCLIILIAAFNIIASLVLFVTEKRRDLGVLLALGATPRQIQRIFEIQSIRIGIVGTAWGMGISVPLCWIVNHYRLLKLPKGVYDFITYMPFHLQFIDLVWVAAFPLCVAWIAARYPAKRASHVDPVDALRAE